MYDMYQSHSQTKWSGLGMGLTYCVFLRKVFEVVEEHGVAMKVVNMFPVRDILFHLACGTMDVETRAIRKPGERKEEGRIREEEGGRRGPR